MYPVKIRFPSEMIWCMFNQFSLRPIDGKYRSATAPLVSIDLNKTVFSIYDSLNANETTMYLEKFSNFSFSVSYRGTRAGSKFFHEVPVSFPNTAVINPRMHPDGSKVFQKNEDRRIFDEKCQYYRQYLRKALLLLYDNVVQFRRSSFAKDKTFIDPMHFLKSYT